MTPNIDNQNYINLFYSFTIIPDFKHLAKSCTHILELLLIIVITSIGFRYCGSDLKFVIILKKQKCLNAVKTKETAFKKSNILNSFMKMIEFQKYVSCIMIYGYTILYTK